MVLLESKKIGMGEVVPEFNLKGVDDRNYSLSDFNEKQILVIVFMCNHCPYVQAIWERLNDLQEKFLEKGVQFVGINPNLHPDYDEETMGKMKEYYDEYNMNFPYLQDDTQEIARAFGAECTPDIFVYDKKRKLSYHGRIDDNWQNLQKVKREELFEAIEIILDDGTISEEEQNPSIGCSIKWRN